MRTKTLSFIFVFCLGFLLLGLFFTQVIRHERYRVMSEENRLKIIPLMAPRGSIYDRNGKALVKDVLSFDVAVIYSRIKDKTALADMLSSELEIPAETITREIGKARRQPFTPTVVASNVGIGKAIQLEELSADYPGLHLDVSARREYLRGETASNVLGYLGMINRSEFDRLKHYGYSIRDLVGRAGLERTYDNYLRGRHGGKQVEVDHRGREMTTLGLKEPSSGRDVRLTLDLELQEYCDGLLKNKKGAILAMDPDTGAMIAMSSAPGYDPGVFVDRARSVETVELLNDNEYPLVNRAITGVYPPGSVFKVVVASGAVETAKAGEHTTFACSGVFTLGRATFHCWREGGHGLLALKDAIKNSCNVYFFQLGLLLGADGIAEFARRFGFGSHTGIDLPGEAPGTVPDPEWKEERFNDKWYKGDTVNYSIGQGYMLCTPIQVARMMAVFANDGFIVRPYIVNRIGSLDTVSGEKIEVDISGDTLKTVKEGMWRVVNSPRGTGMKARLRNVEVAGKTGTAQTSRGKNHGWFAGFAPYDDPKLVVVIFDEYGGKGGYYAAQTAGKVFKKADELGLL